MRTRLTLLVSLLPLVLLSGCKARTPEKAFQRFAEAVKNQNGSALFDALDVETRWSWMTIHKAHREAYDIILSNYPEGEQRQRELRRFEAGALASSARELFSTDMAAKVMPMLAPMLDPKAPINVTGPDAAQAVLPSNARIELRRGKNGAWGYAGLAEDSKKRELRAIKDLELVRLSAADFERAAARAAK